MFKLAVGLRADFGNLRPILLVAPPRQEPITPAVAVGPLQVARRGVKDANAKHNTGDRQVESDHPIWMYCTGGNNYVDNRGTGSEA